MGDFLRKIVSSLGRMIGFGIRLVLMRLKGYGAY